MVSPVLRDISFVMLNLLYNCSAVVQCRNIWNRIILPDGDVKPSAFFRTVMVKVEAIWKDGVKPANSRAVGLYCLEGRSPGG